jgi:hypothetical protein
LITVRLIGGLGNQMFQYALGRRLALERGVDLAVDLGWFGRQAPGDTPRGYELACWRADARVAKVEVQLREPSSRPGLLLARVEQHFSRQKIVRQRGAGYDHDVLQAPDGALLIGYWQSERYFASASSAIRADFTPVVPLSAAAAALSEEMAGDDTVSLHVRRGDYVTNAAANRYHGTVGVEYYRAALECIGLERPRIFVFSDDAEWCRTQLRLGAPMKVIGSNDRSPHEDMLLMAACRHHVIANSSYSWWGAWLDPRPDGVVVAPRTWVRDGDEGHDDVYVDGWLRV